MGAGGVLFVSGHARSPGCFCGIWRRMENFSTNSLALVLSSTTYDPDDYIFEYEDFVKIKKESNDSV